MLGDKVEVLLTVFPTSKLHPSFQNQSISSGCGSSSTRFLLFDRFLFFFLKSGEMSLVLLWSLGK